MKKNSITKKITPCGVLPFGTIYWWIQNLNLNTEADRLFIISRLSQNGMLGIDAWKVLINSGTLEADAALSKSEFLKWFDCDRQPSQEQLKLIIEGYKLGNYNPNDEYGVGWTEVTTDEEYNNKVIRKVISYVGGLGSMPTELASNIGKYYAAAGGFTTNKDLATNYKGIQGAAGSGVSISTWTAQNYTGMVQVVKDDVIWELASGQSASSSEVPGISNKWVKKVGSSAKKIFDPTNENDAVVMKAIADRYDWLNTALQIFGDTANSGVLPLTFTGSIILSTGVIQANSNHSMVEISVPSGYKFFNFKGPLWDASAPVDTYPTLLAKLNDGTFKVLQKGGPTSTILDKSFSTSGITSFYINSKNSTLNAFTTSFSVRGLNSVQEYIDGEILKLAPSIDFSKALEKSITDVKFNKISDIDLTTTGSGLLDKNNGIVSGTLSDYKNIQNLPTNGAKYFFYCAKSYTGTEAQLELYASLIGIKKNGELTVLIKGTTDNSKETVLMVDISSYEKISFCYLTQWVTNGWQPVFSFYNVTKKLNLPNIPKAKNVSLNNDIKGGAVTFVDDDINGAALGGLAPFMFKNNLPFGVACIGTVMKANPNTRERIIGFYNLGMLDIINHTENHLPNMHVVSYDEQYQEIKKCKDYLESFGLINDMFASPYGNFNQNTLDILSLLGYNYHFRADTASDGINSVDTFYNMGIYRLNFGLLQAGAGNSLTKEQIKAIILQAHNENKLVVIMTHYRNNVSNPPDFFTQFQEIIDYCKTIGVKMLRPREANEKFSNLIEVDNGFRITRNGQILNEHIPLSSN